MAYLPQLYLKAYKQFTETNLHYRIKKGIRKAVKMTACQKRVNIIGAINLATHQVVYQQVDWINFDSLKVFAMKLCEANPKATTINLILDNAGYHKSKEFTTFIKTTKIKVHYLSPYSPNLNPIERLWKVMREKLLIIAIMKSFQNSKKAY